MLPNDDKNVIMYKVVMFYKKWFLVLLIPIMVLSCLKQTHKKESGPLKEDDVVLIDEDFFSRERIVKNFKNNINENLQVVEFEITSHNAIRLLLSHPVFHPEQIGKKLSKSFFYFKPSLSGFFIPRTSRIIDFFPDAVDNDQCQLIIPEHLTGIHGNISPDIQTFDINFLQDNLREDRRVAPEMEVIGALDETGDATNDDFKSLKFTDLKSEINLKTSTINEFRYLNIKSIKRHYYRIPPRDIPFLIKNIQKSSVVKKYFLNKNLITLPLLLGTSDNIEESVTYIPPDKKGLFFCYQAVIFTDGTYKDYFQIYNFSKKNVIGFDTEKSILFYVTNNTNQSGKNMVSVYSPAGEIVDSGYIKSSSLYKTGNDGFDSLYVLIHGNERLLYEVKLHAVDKSYYTIFANFDDRNPEKIIINGLLRAKEGPLLDNTTDSEFSYMIKPKAGTGSKRGIMSIDQSGVFTIEYDKPDIMNNEFNLVFYGDNKVIKRYTIHTGGYDAANSDNVSKSTVLYLKEKTILDDNPAVFLIDDAYINQIDSVYYIISKDQITEQEELYNKTIDKRLAIDIPAVSGTYGLNIEIVLKNGDSIKNDFIINKIVLDETAKRSKIGNKLVIDITPTKNNGKKLEFEFTNPFSAGSALVLLYNDDVYKYYSFPASHGKNTISINKSYIDKSNLKLAVIVFDADTAFTIYYVKDVSKEELVVNDLNGSIAMDNNAIVFRPANGLRSVGGRYLFVSLAGMAQKGCPLYKAFFRFNDMLCDTDTYFGMNRGYLIDIEEDNQDSYVIDGVGNTSSNLHISLIGLDYELFNYHAPIAVKSDIDITFNGPDAIFLSDRPVLEYSLKNISGKKIMLNARINGKGCLFDNERDIKEMTVELESNETKTVEFMISDVDKDKDRIELSIQTFTNDRLLSGLNNYIKLNRTFLRKSIEVAGIIIGNRVTSSELKIPYSDYNDYDIEVCISNDKYLGLFKNNMGLENYTIDFCETSVYHFLNDYFTTGADGTVFDNTVLNSYYVNDKGYKRYHDDNDVNLDTTLFVLFIKKILFNQTNDLIFNKILDYILFNYENEILDSPLRIFILGEIGIFYPQFDDVFLDTINGKMESLFYYRYFQKNRVPYELKAQVQPSDSVFYNECETSPILLDLLTLYFELDDVDVELLDYRANIFDSIFAKLLIINRVYNKRSYKKDEQKSTDFIFSSKELGDFEGSVVGNDIVVRHFNYSYLPDEVAAYRNINYSIEKATGDDLYYLIKAVYKSDVTGFSKNNTYELYTEFLDNTHTILDKDVLMFEKERMYYVNLYIVSESERAFTYIKPLEATGLKIDYSFFSLNNRPIKNDNINKWIKIFSLKKGINTLRYRVMPYYTGHFDLNSHLLVDYCDLNNYIIEPGIKLEID